MNDEAIVEKFLKRDQTAIRQTQRKYGERICAISRGITRDQCTAEEVENDTYLKAWESIPPNAPYSCLFAYLARLARNVSLNVCRNRIRLKRNAVVVELSQEMEQCIPSEELVETEFDGKLLAEKISSFLDNKSDEKRNIFMRRYWFMDSVKDIAKRFDLSESNVKTTLFRLRGELKEYLEKEGYFC